MSRQFTNEEIQKRFISMVKNNCEYWIKESLSGISPELKVIVEPAIRKAVEGVTFSNLVIIDGESMLPGFLLIPNSSEEDKQFHIEQDENYYPVFKSKKAGDYDIGGNLHHLFCNEK